jgi:hypothetical protein
MFVRDGFKHECQFAIIKLLITIIERCHFIEKKKIKTRKLKAICNCGVQRKLIEICGVIIAQRCECH